MADSTTLNVLSSPGAGRAEQILGVHQIYKVESRHTGGQVVCVEIVVPPGQGIPPHRHSSEDECFYVVNGEVTFTGDDCEGRPLPMQAGSLFYGPRGRVHGFSNRSDSEAKLLVIVMPGSEIEAMFAQLAALTERGRAGMELAAVAAICRTFGIEFVQADESAAAAAPAD